jgi:hypothetical protein
MISKPVALGLLAIACLSATAGGAYFAAWRTDTPQAVAVEPAAPQVEKAGQGVAETEAIVEPTTALESVTPARVEPAAYVRKDSRDTQGKRDSQAAAARGPAAAAPPERGQQPTIAPEPAPAVEYAATPSRAAADVAPTPAPAGTTALEPAVPEAPPAPAKPDFVEVVVPASSVVGLSVVTSITSETARVEDRVEARVTRDVLAEGRVAIPAGTRVIGDVTLVERGGKMKDKARLGVRFHTLVLADGSQIPFRSDAISREGASPGNESARKIGGAAIGGAILGAIIGGAKGAAIGGATGAAGGSAVVMAGDRNAATLPAGTVVTVRLSSPVSIDVEREQ